MINNNNNDDNDNNENFIFGNKEKNDKNLKKSEDKKNKEIE